MEERRPGTALMTFSFYPRSSCGWKFWIKPQKRPWPPSVFSPKLCVFLKCCWSMQKTSPGNLHSGPSLTSGTRATGLPTSQSHRDSPTVTHQRTEVEGNQRTHQLPGDMVFLTIMQPSLKLCLSLGVSATVWPWFSTHNGLPPEYGKPQFSRWCCLPSSQPQTSPGLELGQPQDLRIVEITFVVLREALSVSAT